MCTWVDFVTDMPVVNRKLVMIVVVDHLTKSVHLGASLRNYSTTYVVDFFINNIVKLHSVPTSIVSDRDRVFTGRFWKELQNATVMIQDRTLTLSTN